MKDNLTEIVAILDASGSMQNLAVETLSGYNTFIDEQKKVPGEAKLTTVLFNDKYKLLYDRVDIQKAEQLTDKKYRCDGMTCLLDAMGKTIDTIGQKLSDTDEAERPSKVVFLIITDGQENASKEYEEKQVRDKIKLQKETYSWEFIFLAKDIETVLYAKDIGINNSVMYCASAIGTEHLYRGITNQVNNLRHGGVVDLDALKEDLKVKEN